MKYTSRTMTLLQCGPKMRNTCSGTTNVPRAMLVLPPHSVSARHPTDATCSAHSACAGPCGTLTGCACTASHRAEHPQPYKPPHDALRVHTRMPLHATALCACGVSAEAMVLCPAMRCTHAWHGGQIAGVAYAMRMQRQCQTRLCVTCSA